METTGAKRTKEKESEDFLDLKEPLTITITTDKDVFEVAVSRPTTIGTVLLCLANAYSETRKQAMNALDKLEEQGYNNSTKLH